MVIPVDLRRYCHSAHWLRRWFLKKPAEHFEGHHIDDGLGASDAARLTQNDEWRLFVFGVDGLKLTAMRRADWQTREVPRS